MAPLQIEHKLLALEVTHKGILHSERFELVRIAFKQALANQANPDAELRKLRQPGTPTNLAKDAVELADAVLAAMEKKPSPEAVKAPAEQGNAEVLAELRAELLGQLNAELRLYADNPTTEQRTIGCRQGFIEGRRGALEFIDRAIEKARKPEVEKTP